MMLGGFGKVDNNSEVIAFKTDNSMYYINEESSMISGGTFGFQWRRYEDLYLVTGEHACIQLPDDRELRTSRVVKIYRK